MCTAPLQMRFCMVKLVAKLLFQRTRRGFQDELDRQIHAPLAAQAARQGVLKETLRLLEDSSESPAVAGLASVGFGPSEQDA